MGGYAVECALKACIAKRTQQHDFPDKKLVNDSHTHDLEKLLHLAELKDELEEATQKNSVMKSNWIIVRDWSETSRYEMKLLRDARGLLQAIEDREGGLLAWVQQRW